MNDRPGEPARRPSVPTGSKSWPRCSSPSPRSPRRGPSYQAMRWNGEQARAASRTTALRIEAARADGLCRQSDRGRRRHVHPVDRCHRQRRRRAADVLRERFRPEFAVAFDAWLATAPLTTPGAPATPFAMDDYATSASIETDRLDTEAAASSAIVSREHPTRLQLRAGGGAHVGVALLRRHQHEAAGTARCARSPWLSAASCSSAPPCGSPPSPSASRSDRLGGVSRRASSGRDRRRCAGTARPVRGGAPGGRRSRSRPSHPMNAPGTARA